MGDDEDALKALALDDRTGRDRVTHSGNRGKADDLKNTKKINLQFNLKCYINTIKLGYS